MNKMAKLMIVLIILSSSTIAFSQCIISGKILNQETLRPIRNVNIRLNAESEGSITTPDGTFKFETNTPKVHLHFTSIGYKSKDLFVNSTKASVDLGIIYLQPTPYSLDEISINAGLSENSSLPVSISTISSKEIETKLGNRPLPLIFQTIPGVYSTRNGGGSGDAKLSIRGFKQEDVSILLNGIPINGEENGLIYWSNWLGLSTVAAEIQIQKGPGLTNAAISAIGGSVNIVTKNVKKQKSSSVAFEVSSYGNFTASIAINSGELNNGWNTSAMFSYGTGSGYVDATFVKSFAYFLTAQKQLSKKHKITITLLGAPQSHGQQTIKLSNDEITKYGIKYNKDWGSYNGKTKNASVNFYHKPFLNIIDELKLNDKNTLSTSIYLSAGYGGGQWSESFNYAPSIFTYRNFSGQINWNKIYENNATHDGTYILENEDTVSGYSLNVQTNYLASHVQAGVMTNYEHIINNKLKLVAGIHYRYFNSYLREEIDDLLGGDFFIEDYSWSLAGVANRNQIKTVGDIIRVDNNSIINFANTYLQLVYENHKITSFISANINNNWYKRIDRFNYISNTSSNTILKQGWDLRAGFSFNINEFQSLYINASTISRVPFFKYVFGNYTNVVVRNLKNENINTVELGYKLYKGIITADVNIFSTYRKNVSTLSNEYVQLEDNTQTRAMIVGLNALHSGIEMEVMLKLNHNTKIGGMMMIGDYKWQNNVTARLFNDNNIAVDTIDVYAKGLNIGGTAQQQYGVFANFAIMKIFFLKFEYLHFADIYSDFNATNRNNPVDISQPFQLPAYGTLNTYLDIPFSIDKYYGRIQIAGYNLLKSNYIVTGEDGTEHNLETFRGFWAFGRNLTFSLKFSF